MADLWAVFRQDFTGNNSLVEKNLTEKRARELVVEFESHKHHQHYWVDQIAETEPDYTALLRDSLDRGSPLVASLKILRNQNAPIVDCFEALQNVCNIDAEEAKRILVASTVLDDRIDDEEAIARYLDEQQTRE